MRTGYLMQLFLATAVIYCCVPSAVCVFEQTIKDFLEEFRYRMCHPIPGLGLPALDPLRLGPAKISANNKYLVDFTGSIDDFELRGISDFNLTTLNINILPGVQRSTVNVTFPHTFFKSLYTAKGSLAYILNLAGDGKAEAHAKDFWLMISWRMKAGLTLAITSLRIELHLGDLLIDFENLLEEERINAFWHALINEMGIELLGDLWNYEHETVVEKVEALINSKINDIIGSIIGGGGEEGESSPIFEGVEPDCKPKNTKLD